MLYAYKLSLKVSSKCIHPNYYFYCFECVHRVCPNLSPHPVVLGLVKKILEKKNKNRKLRMCLGIRISNLALTSYGVFLPRKSLRGLFGRANKRDGSRSSSVLVEHNPRDDQGIQNLTFMIHWLIFRDGVPYWHGIIILSVYGADTIAEVKLFDLSLSSLNS
jgi:hypothetical protein